MDDLDPEYEYKRAILACRRCRKRKTKCSGETPCRSCAGGSHECVYPETGQKVSVSKDYLHHLEAQLRAYKNAAGIQRSQPVSVPETIKSSDSPLSSIETGPDEINNPLMEGMAQLVLSPSGQHQYLGNSSSTNLGLRFRDFVKTLKSEDYDPQIEVEYPTYNDAAWPIDRPPISTLLQLPPYDVAKRLYAAQHTYIGTIFSFVDPELFSIRLKRIYQEEPDFSQRDTCLTYCQALLVFAYGQMYSINQWMGHEGPPGFSYFTQALQFLPNIREEGSVLFVEVLSLVGYFYQNLNRRDAAFLYIGLALRMAISLGLHQEVSATLDATAREHRRRVWWSVYSMDRILSCKSGNPITIADKDISVLAPSPWPGQDPATCSATVLAHYTELSRILGRISKNIYRKNRKTGSSLAVSVQGIMKDLSNWLRNLPSAIRIDLSKKSSNVHISREQVSIFLHYYQCINMTARPLLFHVVQKRLQNRLDPELESDWRKGLAPTTVAVIDACVAAARDSTTIMASAAKQNLVATYGFMDGEHAFSAAIVLVMAKLAFPHNARDAAAMETALSVLHDMAERGNHHIKARHHLLVNLRNKTEGLSNARGFPIPSSGLTTDYNSRIASSPTSESRSSSFSIAPTPAPPGPYGLQELGLGNADFMTGASVVDPTTSLEQMFSWENTAVDMPLWEEGYGNLDVTGMDFDWTHEAQRILGGMQGAQDRGMGQSPGNDESTFYGSY